MRKTHTGGMKGPKRDARELEAGTNLGRLTAQMRPARKARAARRNQIKFVETEDLKLLAIRGILAELQTEKVTRAQGF